MGFLVAFLVLVLIGGGIVALMNTDVGQMGCGCICIAIMLAGIAAGTLFVVAVFGIGCAVFT